ncbi:DUF2254 family protein [Microcoleus sp. herbarium19]|uniref:DUF2254 family protein n=1 Tax=unclassified Microcoleus TaxID=2642155 RepID=UPI002FD4585C
MPQQLTILALQLASSIFFPRLLRNFMQDTGNQNASDTLSRSHLTESNIISFYSLIFHQVDIFFMASDRWQALVSWIRWR